MSDNGYPFHGHLVSAFIPGQMSEPQEAQAAWLQRQLKKNRTGLFKPAPATGETMQVLQYYDGALQAVQINNSLNGPGMHSVWVNP